MDVFSFTLVKIKIPTEYCQAVFIELTSSYTREKKQTSQYTAFKAFDLPGPFRITLMCTYERGAR